MGVKTAVFSTLAIAIVLSGCRQNAASYVAKGNKYFAEKKYPDAMLQYRKASQLDRKYSDAYYRMALVELQQYHYSQAYDLLALATQFSPRDRAPAIALGDLTWSIYAADDRPAPKLYNDISHLSERLLADNPRDFDGLRFKADIAIADKRLEDAINLLNQANAIQPLRPSVILPLAQLLAQKGDLATAEKLLVETLAQNPSHGPSYTTLYALYMREKRTAEAEALIRQRIQKNPKETAALIQLAEHYANQGNLVAMNGVLRDLVNNRAQYSGVRAALGDFYTRHKQADEAIQQFQEAIQEDPKSEIDFRKKIAAVLLSQGRTAELEKCLDDILTKDPKNFEVLRLKASILMSSKKPEQMAAALKIYQQLVDINPNDTSLRFDHAMTLLATGDAKSARSELTMLIQRDPGAVGPKLALADLGFSEKRYSETIELTNQLLARDPEQTLARVLHAMALSGLGLYGEARGELTRLVRDQPNNPLPELELGMLDVIQKRYSEANAIFEKYHRSNQFDPKARSIEGLVRTDVAQGQFEKAVQLLTEEVQKSPHSVTLRSLLTSVAATAGRYELALAQCQALAAMAPKSAEIQLRWANLLREKGDAQGAIDHYQKAKELAPKSPQPAALLAHELASAGRTQEAIATYRQVLQLDPNDVFTLNNLAFLLADSGENMEEALQMAQTARRLANDNSAVADTLGWVYLKKGLTSSALRVFETLVRTDPKNPTYHYHFGATLLVTGDKAKAKSELETALGSKPSQTEGPKIQELLRKIG